MPGTFSQPPRVNDPDMHHGTCVPHVPSCMPGSLSSGFLCSRWWGKLSLHSRHMRNPQFCVSGKRPMGMYCFFVLRLSMVLPGVHITIFPEFLISAEAIVVRDILCVIYTYIFIYIYIYIYIRFTFFSRGLPKLHSLISLLRKMLIHQICRLS